MNISPWMLYWVTRLDEIKNVCFGFGFISLLLFCVFIIMNLAYFFEENDFLWNKHFAVFSLTLSGFMLCLILGITALFIPTTKEAIAIIVIPKIVNNERVQQLPPKMLDLVDEWIEELRPGKDGK
jgi:hypothetical protein